MSKGKPISREEALKLVPKIEKMLEGRVKRMMVCGSLRRGVKQIVNDIDVVVIPSEEWQTDRKSFQYEIDGVQIDVNLTTEESWGASTLMWTGTKELNVKMRAVAKEKGLKLNQYGLFYNADGKKIAGRTEEEMFEALGLKYLEPHQREVGWYGELEREYERRR